jgi:hypothetical protein
MIDAVHTRACRGMKKRSNSVTDQNRTHVYMNFFDHKDQGNHILQLCPKGVKHPACFAIKENINLMHGAGDRDRGERVMLTSNVLRSTERHKQG